MKRLILKWLSLSVFLLLFFSSCKDKPFDKFFESQFPEASHADGIYIDGSFAVPIIDSYFTLENFIPSTDSSLWAEVDDQDLVHLRMYFKDIVVFTAKEIYPNYFNGNDVVPQGTLIAKDSASANSTFEKLKVYQNALSGHLFFDDPRITFIFKNEIPIVTFFRLDSLRFLRPDNTVLEEDNIGKYTIGAPQNDGEVVTSSVKFTKNEIPSLENLFAPIPKRMSVGITAGSDQNQTTPFDIHQNDKISLDVDIDLPLIAHLNDLTMGDTSDFVLEKDTAQEITAITLKLIIDNEFPVTGLAQITFTDSLYRPILRVFEDSGWEFASAEIDQQGISTASVESKMTVTLTHDDVKLLQEKGVQHLIMTVTLNSPKPNNDTEFDVRIYGWYKLGVKLGVKFDYAINY